VRLTSVQTGHYAEENRAPRDRGRGERGGEEEKEEEEEEEGEGECGGGAPFVRCAFEDRQESV